MGLRRATAPTARTPWSTRARDALRGRVRWAVTAVVLAALPAVFVVAFSGEDKPDRLSAEYVRTGSWDNGFSAQYILRNAGDETVQGWTLRFRLPPGSEVTTLWNGRLDRDGARYTIRSEDWNHALRPGETAVVGFEARHVDPSVPPFETPVDCTINRHPCMGGALVESAGERSRTAPEPTATSGAGPANPRTQPGHPVPGASSGAAATGSPPPGGATAGSGAGPGTAPPPQTPASRTGNPGGTAQGVPLRPYLDLAAPGSYDLAAAAAATGITDWTLAFVVDLGGCRPAWGGGIRLDDPGITAKFAELRALGGRASVSFGGAAGTDLAASCATPEELAAAYRAVVDTYEVDRIDLDVEGRSLGRPDIVERRNIALGLLRDGLRRDGRSVEITYTLPAGPAGLGPEAMALLRDAAARQVGVDSVNLLAMDYGAANAPDPAGNMGRYAMDAARAAHGQLRSIWLQMSDQQAWQILSVTPLIGSGDVPGEVFTLADARQLAAFAAANNLGRLSWWSAVRDRACSGTNAADEPPCSGLPQVPHAYARAFQAK
ncbi:glycoside hydrolase family 18 protein [Yinghuangia soli]|uniref:Cellulose binding domain-containing protein n=1 Tax=Yinghuangia soli TaxID=2908204 RepID=A0AA41Q8N3_9ACTN|nr:cellulose binding domain-containing protein [Yinghuangia soli]MCF2532940.1 cellulose binding domain-containing protein [Yinghuangia soli]